MTKALQLATFLPYRFNNLAERISFALSRIYSERFDIAIPQWRILATLAEQPNLLARDIGRQTHMDKVRVSRAVKALESRGLLQREASPGDSRASTLALTAPGLAMYARIAPMARDWEARLLQPLTPRERDQLFRILAKLDRSIGALEPGADDEERAP
jgi:DNA-binding MarR family transcriptional regulator